MNAIAEDPAVELHRLKTHDSIMTERVLDLERQIDALKRRPVAPAWMPCATQLPDDDQTVLLALADGEVWTGYHDAGEWYYVSADPIGVEVVAWMDFPEHPGNAGGKRNDD